MYVCMRERETLKNVFLLTLLTFKFEYTNINIIKQSIGSGTV